MKVGLLTNHSVSYTHRTRECDAQTYQLKLCFSELLFHSSQKHSFRLIITRFLLSLNVFSYTFAVFSACILIKKLRNNSRFSLWHYKSDNSQPETFTQSCEYLMILRVEADLGLFGQNYEKILLTFVSVSETSNDRSQRYKNLYFKFFCFVLI